MSILINVISPLKYQLLFALSVCDKCMKPLINDFNKCLIASFPIAFSLLFCV